MKTNNLTIEDRAFMRGLVIGVAKSIKILDLTARHAVDIMAPLIFHYFSEDHAEEIKVIMGDAVEELIKEDAQHEHH